jgi:hypothetical protein
MKVKKSNQMVGKVLLEVRSQLHISDATNMVHISECRLGSCLGVNTYGYR